MISLISFYFLCRENTIVGFYLLILENSSALNAFLFCCCCYPVEVMQELSDIVTTLW